jgi:sugar lactone lactonase YvrE
MRQAGNLKYALGILILLAVGACGDSSTAQGAGAGPNDAPNPYRLDPGWAKTALGRNFGSTIGIAADPDGMSIWVYDRCGGFSCTESRIAPLQKFDADGNLVAAIGEGLTNYPHGLAVDDEGNVWITDATEEQDNGQGHTVRKLSPTGEVLMTLGTPGVAGDGENTFNRPSSVAIGLNGEIYVGDGHGGDSNARVMKFDAEGNFIKSWGQYGSGPGEFDQPHAMVVDSTGRLFVGDRGNNRIQIFDAEGNFLEEWKQFGRPSGLYLNDDDILYVADSQSDEMLNPGYEQGIRIGSTHDGVVKEFIHGPELAGAAEGVAADSAGNVYVGYTGGTDFKRFVK